MGNYDSCYESIIKKRNIDIFVDQKFEESGCQLRQKYFFLIGSIETKLLLCTKVVLPSQEDGSWISRGWRILI
jgi:hypothetical protein